MKNQDYREIILIKYIAGKDVLDLGVGDIRDRFLHKFIVEHSSNTLGVELDRKRADKLKKMGYNVIVGNAEDIKIDKKFDVIVAGDLIEHINNVGLFLENIKYHLKDNGVFIFNTPNIYSINLLLRGILLGGNVKQFPEHVCGFNNYHIHELMRRFGFHINKEIYFTHPNTNLNSLIIRLFSKISKKWNENMCFICSK